MNFSALMYYKNIGDICNAYNQKIAKIEFDTTDENKRATVYDTSVFLFSQATEMYCKICNAIKTAELPEETKSQLYEAVDEIKNVGKFLLDQIERMHSIDPDKFDPTKEYSQIGQYVFCGDRSQKLIEMLGRAESQHQKTMTKVREYKNAIVNGEIMSKYSMVDAAAATHQLAKTRALIDHCLSPATLISEEKDAQKIGTAIQRKIAERENTRQVGTAITQQGLLCTMYSHELTIKDQQKVMQGDSVEFVLANKDTTENIEDFSQIFSLLTTDHTGLTYTQRSNKIGEMQIGKWFKKDECKIAHLLTFRSQNKWDGTKLVRNYDFVNAFSSALGIWKNIKNGFEEVKSHLSPFKRQVDKILDDVLSQETAEKVADMITDPKTVKLTIRAENKWAVVQKETDIDFLMHIRHENYMRTWKNYTKRHAEVTPIKREDERIDWDLTKRYASNAMSAANASLEFVQTAIKEKTISLGSAFDMIKLALDHIVPFDDFSSSDINQNIERTLGYSEKLLAMAVANEKWLETQDVQYRDQIKKIGNSMDPKEAKRYMYDMGRVAKYEAAVTQLRSSQDFDDRDR